MVMLTYFNKFTIYKMVIMRIKKYSTYTKIQVFYNNQKTVLNRSLYDEQTAMEVLNEQNLRKYKRKISISYAAVVEC